MRKSLIQALASTASRASTGFQRCNTWSDSTQLAALQPGTSRSATLSYASSGAAPATSAGLQTAAIPFAALRGRATGNSVSTAQISGGDLAATSSATWSSFVRGLAGRATPNLILSSGPGKHARSVRERVYGAAWPTKRQVQLDKKLQTTQDPALILKSLQNARNASIKLNPVNMTTALLQLTRAPGFDPASLRDHPMIQRLAHSLHEQLRLHPNTFSDRSLVLSLYGAARLLDPTQPATHATMDHALAVIRHRGVARFSTEHLGYLAWAVAATATRAPELYSAIETVVLQRGLTELARPQPLIQFAWAFAVSGHASSPLLPAIQRELAVRGLAHVSSRGVGHLAHAYGSLGATPASQGALGMLQDGVLTRGLAHLGAGELSQLVWGLARARVVPAPGWRDAVVADVLRRGLGAGKGQVGGADLARLVWGMVANGHDVKELLNAVEAGVKAERGMVEGKGEEEGQVTGVVVSGDGKAEATAGVLTQLTAEELRDLEWAFAFAGHPGQALFRKEIWA